MLICWILLLILVCYRHWILDQSAILMFLRSFMYQKYVLDSITFLSVFHFFDFAHSLHRSFLCVCVFINVHISFFCVCVSLWHTYFIMVLGLYGTRRHGTVQQRCTFYVFGVYFIYGLDRGRTKPPSICRRMYQCGPKIRLLLGFGVWGVQGNCLLYTNAHISYKKLGFLTNTIFTLPRLTGCFRSTHDCGRPVGSQSVCRMIMRDYYKRIQIFNQMLSV